MAEGTETAVVAAITTNEGEGGVVAAAEVVTAVTAPTEEPAAVQAAMPVELSGLIQMVTEFGGVAALRDALASLRTNLAQERDGLIRDLTANKQCAFGRDDLAGMSTAQLTKLQRSLRPADYSARMGVAPVTANNEWRPYEPIKAG